jgi:hypothetical protein
MVIKTIYQKAKKLRKPKVRIKVWMSMKIISQVRIQTLSIRYVDIMLESYAAFEFGTLVHEELSMKAIRPGNATPVDDRGY